MLGSSYSLMIAGWMLAGGEQSLVGIVARTSAGDNGQSAGSTGHHDCRQYLHLHSRQKKGSGTQISLNLSFQEAQDETV